ncbi:hypothetical protein [Runella salmonicolor]|uniref:Uncharacterized protein n=1 Tax=Runella salmonicolor TaxID=2950278 RepID=A0ABT1FXJ9_9BACT|nr:hypothetical protein [Runella salmonicolor]MCP1386377.1 hypothetical protein [Runella salmonicolor]
MPANLTDLRIVPISSQSLSKWALKNDVLSKNELQYPTNIGYSSKKVIFSHVQQFICYLTHSKSFN